MKSFLKALFCPLWLLFEHNPNETITNEKTGVVKYIFAVVFVAIVIVLVYFVWGELL